QPGIMSQRVGGFCLQPGKPSERFLQILQPLPIYGSLVMLRHNAVDFTLRSVLPLRQWIELGLRDNHLFVRPAHGDELTDKWHLKLAPHFLFLLFAGMLSEPMRERVEESEVPVHVLVFYERPTHDDLPNPHQRYDASRRIRVGDERRDR